MLYVDVNVEVVKISKGLRALIHKPMKQWYVSNHYYERGKKVILSSIPDDRSIEEELCKEMYVKVNFCDTEKLVKANDICYEDNSKYYVFIKKR